VCNYVVDRRLTVDNSHSFGSSGSSQNILQLGYSGVAMLSSSADLKSVVYKDGENETKCFDSQKTKNCNFVKNFVT